MVRLDSHYFLDFKTPQVFNNKKAFPNGKAFSLSTGREDYTLISSS